MFVVLIVVLTLTKYCASAETNSLADIGNIRIICYYASWSAARTGIGKFTPENIDPNLCTHLMYAFGGITKDGTFMPSDENLDIKQGGYANFTGLKVYNKDLKTFIALGGWKEGDVRFSSIAASSRKRSVFIKNSIEFLRKYNFDGLNFDWQYPYRRDRKNYLDLIQELREAYEKESVDTGRPRLLLTITLPIAKEHITKGYNIPEITKYVDWMNVLTYDYHTTTEPVVNHHSQLYGVADSVDDNSDYEFNANYTINTYLDSGAERDKLVLGIPTYGRAFTLEDSTMTDIGSPTIDSGFAGPQTSETGFLAYYEICTKIKDDGWIVKQPHPEAMGSYAYKDNQWVGYDDENIMRKKSEYVAENKLGGIYFWLMEYDDFRGSCTGKKFPLIEAAKDALLNATRYVVDNLVQSSKNQGSFNKDIVSIVTTTSTSPLPNQYRSPKSPRTLHNEMISSTGVISDPVHVVLSSPEFPSGRAFVSNPTLVNEDKYDNEVKDTLKDIKKLVEDVKILSKQFQQFIGKPGDIEKLRKLLDATETTTSIYESESQQQEILNTQIIVNQQIK